VSALFRIGITPDFDRNAKGSSTRACGATRRDRRVAHGVSRTWGPSQRPRSSAT